MFLRTMELGGLLSPAARREAEAQAEAAMEEEREAMARSAERAKQQLRVEARECTRLLLDDVPGRHNSLSLSLSLSLI